VYGRRARGVPYKDVGRMLLAACRPTRSSKRRALKTGADGQEGHQFTADEAPNDAEAAAQSGQYRGGEDGSSQCGCQVGSRRTQGDTRGPVRGTARLSALTHLSPIFGLGMGRPDRVCHFFFWPAGGAFSVQTRLV
jgi:hypothetical protein